MPTPNSIGWKVYDQCADPATDFGLMVGNVGPTLIDLGVGCVPFAGGTLALNPADPIFALTLNGAGILPFAPALAPNSGADFSEVAYCSNVLPISPACGLIDASLKWQGFTLDIVLGVITRETQIIQMRLRDGQAAP